MVKRITDNDILSEKRLIFEALEYAAVKHRHQRRKGASGIPYINHPIEVCRLLLTTLDSPSTDLLIAALLHDTLEDTDANEKEIMEKFGEKVLRIVLELTDNMKLSSAKRKEEQVVKAKSLSYEARCIKISDKTCNIHDIIYTRMFWPDFQKKEYIRWAMRVIAEISDTHPALMKAFYEKVREAEQVLKTSFL